MGKKALEAKRRTQRTIRSTALSAEEAELLAGVTYEGSPHHKASPGDFGLIPPSAPRPDKTLCDEAGVTRRQEAVRLFELAKQRALVSDSTTPQGFPKQFWVLDNGRVFEAMHGGTHPGSYHGYPIRKSDPLHAQVVQAWDDVE